MNPCLPERFFETLPSHSRFFLPSSRKAVTHALMGVTSLMAFQMRYIMSSSTNVRSLKWNTPVAGQLLLIYPSVPHGKQRHSL